MPTEIEDDIRQLTMACSIEDTIDLSIFQTPKLTTKARTSQHLGKERVACINQLVEAMASIPPGQLKVRDSTMRMSQKIENWSAEFLHTCKAGDTSQVKRLAKIKAIIKVETENFHCFRAILWAAISGYLEIICLLLAAGDTGYSVTSQYTSVIHFAAMMGYQDIIEYFSENTGVSINTLPASKTVRTLETLLYLAAAYAPRSIAQNVLSALYSFNENKNPSVSPSNYLDKTSPHRAAVINSAEAVEYMMGVSLGIHDVDQFGRTLFWHSACTGASDIPRVLAGSGELLDLADDIGCISSSVEPKPIRSLQYTRVGSRSSPHASFSASQRVRSSCRRNSTTSSVMSADIDHQEEGISLCPQPTKRVSGFMDEDLGLVSLFNGNLYYAEERLPSKIKGNV